MFIIVDEDFRIDAAGAKLGERQKEYLSVHYYDISAKLMELYGMSSDEIEVYLKKLKAERVINIEDFLREFKPKYKKVIYKFSSFVKRHHLQRWYVNDDCFPKKVLEESWKKFYTGGIYYEERFCYFSPESYLYIIGKHDVVDPNGWTEFVNRNISIIYSTTIEGSRCYTLQGLDKAFEKFESSLGKVEESIENKLAENFANELKNLQKEGLFENIKSFDLDFNGKGISIKLNESRPGNRNASYRYESFKKRSNLKENETDRSKYPFTDLILKYMNRYYDLGDFWPALKSISEEAFYDEVSEETGMDYDDVKDYCWDMVPGTPTIDEIFNELVYIGSEKYLSEKYGTLENLQKILDSDDEEAACEEFANRFDSLYTEDGSEDEYKSAVDYAVADLEARFNRDDEDDDDEYSDED